MLDNKFKLRISLIGLKKTEVDSYIDDIKKYHQGKRSEVIGKIRELEENKFNLQEKIKALNEEINLKAKSSDLMKYSIKKSKEWVETLHENSKKKASEIKTFARQEEANIDVKIGVYDEFVKSSKQKLINELNSEFLKNTELMEEMNKFINEENRKVLKVKGEEDTEILSGTETSKMEHNLDEDNLNIEESVQAKNIELENENVISRENEVNLDTLNEEVEGANSDSLKEE